mmetsp:Transcript_106606/g.318624  ORF Transcript_106606/g.318624 Transcript_106606/m.318624 type:complete len:303 (-) Transcript_106606:204-1112(-)
MVAPVLPAVQEPLHRASHCRAHRRGPPGSQQPQCPRDVQRTKVGRRQRGIPSIVESQDLRSELHGLRYHGGSISEANRLLVCDVHGQPMHLCALRQAGHNGPAHVLHEDPAKAACSSILRHLALSGPDPAWPQARGNGPLHLYCRHELPEATEIVKGPVHVGQPEHGVGEAVGLPGLLQQALTTELVPAVAQLVVAQRRALAMFQVPLELRLGEVPGVVLRQARLGRREPLRPVHRVGGDEDVMPRGEALHLSVFSGQRLNCVLDIGLLEADEVHHGVRAARAAHRFSELLPLAHAVALDAP